MPDSASGRSHEDAARSLTTRARYICTLALRGSLLGLLHDVLVGHLELLYFLPACLQGLRNLIYDLIQIIYYYAHFWHYFYFRFLHKNSVNESPTFPCVL